MSHMSHISHIMVTCPHLAPRVTPPTSPIHMQRMHTRAHAYTLTYTHMLVMVREPYVSHGATCVIPECTWYE